MAVVSYYRFITDCYRRRPFIYYFFLSLYYRLLSAKVIYLLCLNIALLQIAVGEGHLFVIASYRFHSASAKVRGNRRKEAVI